MKDKLFLVVPCYNEQEVLEETAKRLKQKMSALIEHNKISPDSRVVFVNDGSKDATWEMIVSLHHADPLFSGICLSRNRGHQNAVLAGLMTVREEADMVISLDADLQDDIDAIDEMVEKYYEGNDVVYGVRSGRKTDTGFKRGTAQGFYKLLSRMGVETVYNHADYRLMSRRALAALSEFKEVNLFLRGMVPLVGFKSAKVYYERKERFAGESKYPLSKMIGLAVDGITSLSVKPIRFLAGLGGVLLAVGLVTSLVFFIRWLTGFEVTGAFAAFLCVWVFGSLNLLALGVIGEYVGKTYLETKHRPRFIIEEYLK